MTIKISNRTVCNLCFSENSESYLPVYIRSVGFSEEYNLLKCKKCGLVFLFPPPKFSELKEYYPESYYLESSNDGLSSSLASKLRNDSRGQIIVPGGKLLDVGCGNGNFLTRLNGYGLEVLGIEPSIHGYNLCKSKRLSVMNTFLEDANLPNNTFDVITLNHVLEHTPDPKATLLHIKRLLKPSGTAIIQVPNLMSLAFLVSHEYYINLDLPRHLFSFTRQTLEAYAKSVGLKTIKVKYYTNITAILESLWLKLHNKSISSYDKSVAKRNRTVVLFLELFSLPIKYILSKLELGDAIEVYLLKGSEG